MAQVLMLEQGMIHRELAHHIGMKDSQHGRGDWPHIDVDQSSCTDVRVMFLEDVGEALAVDIAWILAHDLAHSNQVAEYE